VAEQSAAILEKQSISTSLENFETNLKEGAKRYRMLAMICDMRADIYKSPNRMQRLRCLTRLFVGGGYFGNSFYAFGLLSALKDLHFCFFGEPIQG
jgi:hypothetical protein